MFVVASVRSVIGFDVRRDWLSGLEGFGLYFTPSSCFSFSAAAPCSMFVVASVRSVRGFDVRLMIRLRRDWLSGLEGFGLYFTPSSCSSSSAATPCSTFVVVANGLFIRRSMAFVLSSRFVTLLNSTTIIAIAVVSTCPSSFVAQSTSVWTSSSERLAATAASKNSVRASSSSSSSCNSVSISVENITFDIMIGTCRSSTVLSEAP